YSIETAVIVGELYRNNGEWKFNAIGQGTQDKDVSSLANRYR
ncbi:MAG: TerD family protein, partial [Ruminococcus sp.]|nr:TerD family protein [Ruminococcus sp.]